MRAQRVLLAVIMGGVLVALHAHSVFAQQRHYKMIENYFRVPEGRTLGSTAGITVGAGGNNVWVFERCGGADCVGSNLAPILEFDGTGKLVKSLGAGMFVRPHGIYIDRQNNIWVTDGEGPDGKDPRRDGKGHQVFKLSQDGKVLMTLGKPGIAGDAADVFNMPSAVLVAPNGDVFIADGHGGNSNARVLKFTKDGTFIKSWGKKGTGAGDFGLPHALAMDTRGRLFVGDRDNSRIEIFDQDGAFLEEWKQFGRPSGVFIDENDTLYVADSQSNEKTNPGFRKGITIGSARDGKVTAFIPDLDGSQEGVAVDKSGNIYGSLTGAKSGGALRKYVVEH